MKYIFYLSIIFGFASLAMDVHITSRIIREDNHDNEKQVISFVANMMLDNKEYLVEVIKTMSQKSNYHSKASWQGYKLFWIQDECGQWHRRKDELPFNTTTDLFMVLSGAYAYRQFKRMHPHLK